MLSGGATHLGVATDHVIESFRNELWPTYKNGDAVPSELKDQFDLLEQCLEALGVVVWAMVELEADDALASAAAVSADDEAVGRVLICTPDKDLAQCVVGRRVVQLDRRTNTVVDEDGVRAKFGVSPSSIPDWLALVGDSADGFPGLPGWGPKSASAVLARYGHIDAVPDEATRWDPDVRERVRGTERLAAVLASERERAELFVVLATLRVDRGLLRDVPSLEWTGPTDKFEALCRFIGDPVLAERAETLSATRRADGNLN